MPKPFKYDVMRLIDGVRSRSCLWDKSLENYKDRVERHSAWEEIFISLDDTYEQMSREEKRIVGELILNKWTNIRDTFIKTLKTKMGKPKKKYLYYEELKFLIPEGERQAEIAEYSQEDVTNYQDNEQSTSTCTTTVTNQAKKRSKKYDHDSIPKKAKKQATTSSAKKKREIIDEVFDRSEDGVEIFDNSINCEEENDLDFEEVNESDPRIMNEDEAFFASLLPTIVKYNEDDRLEFRMEVLAIMKRLKDKKRWTYEFE